MTSQVAKSWHRIVLGMAASGLVMSFMLTSFAQDEFRDSRSTTTTRRGPQAPNLSEATAILESVVRDLYKLIEPDENSTPNELIAYADLRALRLYTGALEVAGWDFEQAAELYEELDNSRYRGRVRTMPTEPRVIQARERYLAFRETVRTLLHRVRSVNADVEHAISFCSHEVVDQYYQEVVPALQDTIDATRPLLVDHMHYVSYTGPGPRSRNPNPVGNGIPETAVDVDRNRVFEPYEGRGRGQGRYFEIRAYGGPVRVKAIRFVAHNNAFGSIDNGGDREILPDQVATPQQPLVIPCNRNRIVDLSALEVEWVNDSNRKAYATIELVENVARR